MSRALAVTGKLSLLVAAMRAGGARVGVGDLITAHRALNAVDASSRSESYLALRAALCKRYEDLEIFDAAFEGAFPPPEPDPFSDAVKTLAPRMAVPGEGQGEGKPVPAAWS